MNTWKTIRKPMKKTQKKRDRMVMGGGKYMTRAHLIECAELGRSWKYNRQVDDRVAEVPEANYPITLAFPHHHRGGVPCEEHVRCHVIGHGGRGIAFIDMPWEYYLKLPVARARMPKELAEQVRPLVA